MRKDLAKCTTESPRHGLSNARAYKIKYGGRVKIDSDPEHDYLNEFGGYRSSARHRQHNYKSFSDCLGALRGNIRKNVGRPWNKVFSEFSQHLDRRSLSGFHIWTHLMQEVTLHTFMRDGVIYESAARYSRERPASGFYVHPLTGILEYSEPEYHRYRRERRNRKKKISEVEIPVPGCSDWKFVLLDGLWFRRRIVTVKVPSDYYAKGFYTETRIEKKSANRKEIAWISKVVVAWGLHP